MIFDANTSILFFSFFINKQSNDEGSKSRRNGKINNTLNNNSDLSQDTKFNDETYFGPTTRKAWSEWCNSRYKENIETNTSSSLNRKCSTSSETESLSRASNSDKTHNPKTRNSTAKPKKYSPGVTAVVRRATRKSRLSGVSERSRKPGRPKKERIKRSKKFANGLDFLHAQTILSTSSKAGVRSDPAPGCVDQRLDAIHINTLNVSKAKSLNMSLVTEKLDELLEEFKQEYLSFIVYMQTPKYKTDLTKLVDEEKVHFILIILQFS